MQWSDALGKLHGRYPGSPRIVSLVPSLTELLIALGLGAQLTGRTGFCVHPRAALRGIPKLGGTKGFDRERLRALQPTHVLVNIDENRRDEVAALEEFVPHLVVTHPLEARDNLDLYRLLGAWLRCPLLTLGVVARINLQALRLLAKRVPFFHKPAQTAEETP